MRTRCHVLLLCAVVTTGYAAIINVADHGVVPNDPNSSSGNRAVLQQLLQNASNGDRILVPEGSTFYSQGGILVSSVVNVSLDLRGTLVADSDIEGWPTDGHSYAHFLHFVDCSHVTVTGTGGMIDGNGIGWWNRMILPQLFGKLQGHRPKLVYFEKSSDLLIESFRMHNSPSFHLQLDDVARAEVRNITITVDRKHQQQLKGNLSSLTQDTSSPPWLKLQPWDLNTDGIDPKGKDIWIHDCSILNDDDSIAVKPCDANCKYSDCSENMLIENMVMTGFGASIGSVPPSLNHNCVRNITFRHISMPQTGKGIYVKSNPSCDQQGGQPVSAEITNIVYEDVEILEPRWWAIWIGPQQQHEPNSALGEKCAIIYPISGHCPTQGCVDFRNITLRNIRVTRPWLSPGVILGNTSNPMQGISFENVTFDKPGLFPYKGKYLCEHAQGSVRGSSPIPECINHDYGMRT